MPSAYLDDRGVVRVAGPDACAFLQGLVTCNMAKVAPGRPAYGALLTPQGKIIVDFIASEAAGVYRLECPLALAADFAKRLRFYKLRANVEVADVSPSEGVAAAWGEDAGLGEADPRHVALGGRIIGERAALQAAHVAPAALYDAHRIALGIPKGGADYVYGDAFPHEANLDLLNGVDFKKGCYVGQEVVSRVEHRRAVRKRILPVVFDAAAPAPGDHVRAGDIDLGTIGSVAGNIGLAMLRVDRLKDTAATGAPLRAGDAPVKIRSD